MSDIVPIDTHEKTVPSFYTIDNDTHECRLDGKRYSWPSWKNHANMVSPEWVRAHATEVIR